MSAGSDLVLTSHGPGHVHPGHPQGGHHELQHAVPVLPQFSLGRLHSKLKECFSFYFPLGPLYVLENYKQLGYTLGKLSLHELQSLQTSLDLVIILATLPGSRLSPTLWEAPSPGRRGSLQPGRRTASTYTMCYLIIVEEKILSLGRGTMNNSIEVSYILN